MRRSAQTFTGYPVSQWVISGLFVIVVVGLWGVVRHAAKPVSPAAYALGGVLIVAAAGAAVAAPIARVRVDEGGTEVEIRLRGRPRTVRAADIQKIVYAVTEVGVAPGRMQRAADMMVQAYHTLYLLLASGEQVLLLPPRRATPRLGRKLGLALSRRLGKPAVVHELVQGRFAERPM